MSKRIFTKEQMTLLHKNPWVASVTEKSITYTTAFKQKALMHYQSEYHTPQEIFKDAGFDLEVIGHEIPKQCLARWKRDGVGSRRGRSKGTVSFPSLEAQIAYLKAENSFLKQLRAKRAE